MKITNKIMKFAAAFGSAALLASNAHAVLIITPTSGVLNTSRWVGDQTGQGGPNGIDAAIAPIIGSSTELYKQNVGGSEEGGLAASYTTTFSNTASDPEDALVKYDGGTFVGPTAFALVKDGNNSPAWYLFNLTTLGWNGTEDLNFQDFWVGSGAISHVALYGTRGTTNTPDGGSMLTLLGGAVAILGFLRRKVSA